MGEEIRSRLPAVRRSREASDVALVTGVATILFPGEVIR